ncbi:MAG: methyltransferase domain-containing protein, partial [Actinomycetota bacterium]|nr:methyltransferase domain-containing protein [Actinomycetota bacterium]
PQPGCIRTATDEPHDAVNDGNRRPSVIATRNPIKEGTLMTTDHEQAPTIDDQAKPLKTHVAGYVAHRTIAMGLRTGLIDMFADHPDGLSAEGLADRTGYDPFYVGVWCRSALGAGVLARDDGDYRLAPHVDTLLLDQDSPAYIGGVFPVFEQRELFDRFEEVLPTGERMWWDQTSPEWIAGVSQTGTPFYTRMIPDGLAQVPGLTQRLQEGGRIIDTACGVGVGLVRLASHYPACEIVGVDGDEDSLDLADKRVSDAGVSDQVQLKLSPLEEMAIREPATLVTNNVSMHECRDIDRVTANIKDGLEPGGWFVISDFPFPEDDEGLATVPGRIMAGIQFYEAQIDDQLLPRSVYDDLLDRHGFSDVDHVELTPVHALTWGRRPE